MSITVATVALQGTYDVALSVKQHLEWMEQAAWRGADLVVFPEVSVQGYPSEGLRSADPDRVLESYRTAEPVPEYPRDPRARGRPRSARGLRDHRAW